MTSPSPSTAKGPTYPLPTPLGRLAWLMLGLIALLLALIGFVLPVLAGLCFANLSDRVHERLERVPAMRNAMVRWRQARPGSAGIQLRTAAALMALGILETLRMGFEALRGR